VNEKSKRFMGQQRQDIFNALKTFGLSVYEDEIAEDEEQEIINLDSYNFFTIVFGDFKPTDDKRKLIQTIAIAYFSENRDDVDEMSIDIISHVSSVKTVTFTGTEKDRLQVKDMDRYVDRVTLLFRRMIPIDCTV